jgi:distribution and morphology protein 34
MSFKFNWDSFNDDNFYDKLRALLTDALNKGNKPPILSDRIIVRELYLGEESPQLEILEVGDVADDRFRGIFKLTYNGDASITLATKIQANPLKVYSMSAPTFVTPTFLGASAPLSIPLKLTLSDIQLSGIIILVFSKAKGLTLVFRNDPLQSIRVSSTFDSFPGIARFLQAQIEKQIRSLFREELPAILHRLSHRWTPSSGLVLHKGAATTSTSSGPNGAEKGGLVVDDVDKDSNIESSAKTMFMDINPDLPVISELNMKKIKNLGASQQTLSLFSPKIPDTLYRANLEEEEERLFGGYVQTLAEAGNDLAEIARIQSRNYFRNSHTAPKRRVIKLNRGGNHNHSNNKETASAAPPLKEKAPIATTQETRPRNKRAGAVKISNDARYAATDIPLLIPNYDMMMDTKTVLEGKGHGSSTGSLRRKKGSSRKGSPLPPPAYFA